MAHIASAADSGVEGVVSVSPNRPGPIHQGESSTGPAPDVTFVVENAKSQAVASFTTDAKGHFQVSLPPGHYTISRKDAGSRIGHWHFEVDVVAGKMAKVDWTGDSGMR